MHFVRSRVDIPLFTLEADSLEVLYRTFVLMAYFIGATIIKVLADKIILIDTSAAFNVDCTSHLVV